MPTNIVRLIDEKFHEDESKKTGTKMYRTPFTEDSATGTLPELQDAWDSANPTMIVRSIDWKLITQKGAAFYTYDVQYSTKAIPPTQKQPDDEEDTAMELLPRSISSSVRTLNLGALNKYQSPAENKWEENKLLLLNLPTFTLTLGRLYFTFEYMREKAEAFMGLVNEAGFVKVGDLEAMWLLNGLRANEVLKTIPVVGSPNQTQEVTRTRAWWSFEKMEHDHFVPGKGWMWDWNSLQQDWQEIIPNPYSKGDFTDAVNGLLEAETAP